MKLVIHIKQIFRFQKNVNQLLKNHFETKNKKHHLCFNVRVYFILCAGNFLGWANGTRRISLV